ncbi:MAG: UDP-N-acetylglucosamine 2-epimerase [Elusimicrobia bacterium RIFOXYB2_FULL_49_7]|nr:MAG: UDP-N-acetylglucosamine 2-epimerase [Elusimicrobia bacterium RIFOXYB2_FULL_49_7]
MKIINVCGARPNFMKIAPIMEAMKQSSVIKPFLVHTGQHYDEKMSKSFFDALGIPKPDMDLEVGSGSHAVQTAKIMVEFEKVVQAIKPDLVLVVGDVNSTMACAIVAKKLWIPVAHVEAGLRSRDLAMPEEINRLVTDSITDYFFITDPDAKANLQQEGVPLKRIFFAGNVMIDTLLKNLPKADKQNILSRLALEPGEYAAMTLHRPSNVDDKKVLSGLVGAFETIQKRIKIVFPVHPRTRKQFDEFGLSDKIKGMTNFILTDPLNYHEMLKLNKEAKFVLTDSGGIQEETTVLGIPCITMRNNTERPITVTQGTNEVVGNNPGKIVKACEKILSGKWKRGRVPAKWDGKAGVRIVAELEKIWKKRNQDASPLA